MQKKAPTKREKSVTQKEKVVKEKFVGDRELPAIVAKTEKQKHYMKLLNDPSIQIIVCLGLHGTGKSFVSANIAAEKFRKNQIKKIIVARAYVQTGKSSGFKPGSSLEKLYPYVRNVLDPIKQRLGVGAYEVALKDGETGDIQVQEIESIRGRSFDEPSFLLIEEAQQTTPDEMLAIVTRIGDECKLVISGDLNQRDIRGESGLAWFMDFAIKHKLKGVGYVNFDQPEDIVRGGMAREIAIGLMKERK